jgi:proline iminopeptidase
MRIRRFFDPEFYRIIIFDQRGCGRSEPLGETRNNSPTHLVSDIETLRNHLQISKWHVFGGSWGAVLALLYAFDNPNKCISLMLRSVSLFTRDNIDWFLYGMRKIYPEVWDRFAKGHDDNLLESYDEKLSAGDYDAGVQWVDYEGSCSTLYPQFRTITSDVDRKNAWVLARLESYFYKEFPFDSNDGILSNIEKIRHIPGVILHGRYDVITPIEGAHALHKAWPESDFIIVPDGGHSALDPAIRDRILMMTDNARSIR